MIPEGWWKCKLGGGKRFFYGGIITFQLLVLKNSFYEYFLVIFAVPDSVFEYFLWIFADPDSVFEYFLLIFSLYGLR